VKKDLIDNIIGEKMILKTLKGMGLVALLLLALLIGVGLFVGLMGLLVYYPIPTVIIFIILAGWYIGQDM
jgi:hypothetical protein